VKSARADLAVIGVLWRRELLLLVRQRSRVLGTLAQPLLFWIAIGAGLAPTFRMEGSGVGYLQFFFPGVVLMLVLLTTISSTMSLIEDRHQGFLQGVLVAPGSPVAVALGKSLGAATVSGLQAALFLALAPLAGFTLAGVGWGSLALALGLVALALAAIGFTIAWWLDSMQGYHVVMSVVLIPLWMLSGSLFPAQGLHPILAALVRWNPLSYAGAALRRALHGGVPPEGTALGAAGAPLEWAVLAGLTVAAIATAAWAASRRPTG
jgi:daunorubicin resistance ABC transporter membrane protein